MVRVPFPIAALAALCFTPMCTAPAHALPAGRAWATWENLAHPQLVQSGTPRLEVDSTGVPIMIVASRWDTSRAGLEWSVFRWKESGWVPHLLTSLESGFPPDPVVSLDSRHYVLWVKEYESGPLTSLAALIFTSIFPQVGQPETTMVTLTQSSEYGGAVSARRRWVVRSQQRYPIPIPFDGRNRIRTVYSDTVGIWHELPELGLDEFMCTIAPLTDYSAMVVYSTGVGLRWARAEGEEWAEQGVVDPRGGLHPRLRVRPSGGLWLMWTTGFGQKVYVASYRDGAWQPADSTTGVHAPGETYVPAWCDISRDPSERPAITWGDLGFGLTFRDVGSIAFPTEAGWSPGEEVPGSDGLFDSPRITRDRNGDAWVAWKLKRVGLARFNHTYVSATTSAPQVLATAKPGRVIAWTLSEPAPESWWAVLRARNDGPGGGVGAGGARPFEEVARVEAGATTEMSWTDTSPPAGVLRYRIRRESVDARYRWESEVAHWPPRSHRALSLTRASPALADGRLELAGAEAGPVKVRVYDIQGRVVLEQESQAGGSGRDTVQLDLVHRAKSLPNGIYFAAAWDASGRTTNALKILVLR